MHTWVMAIAKKFMYYLSMAACEWFLMFLMFFNAALSFILTKFAHHCELQTPCLFCMRLDHVFSNEKPGSYLKLFCYKHRSEISCLLSCDLHEKLVDVRELCDDCFMSIMNQNQCNHDDQIGMKGYQKPYLNRNLVRGPSTSGTCSCCKRQWKGQPSSRRLIHPGPVPLGVPTVTLKPPLPRIEGHGRFRRRSFFKRARDKISGSSTPVGNSISMDMDLNMDALSDSGYADHRFNSDSESEFSFCDEDDLTSKLEILSKKGGHEDVHHDRSISSPASLTPLPSNPQDVDCTHDQRKLSSIDVKENGDLQKSDGNLDHEGDKSYGYESPGASSVSEKGESDVEKVKGIVGCDQERLHLLQAELEEERNAAAIAADEAMAMITRLQEEKASLHMEALQYLRMMDEQAEYDMEALDKANDLVVEKDKEIQDLEAELEYFRTRYEDELMMGNENETPKNFIRNRNSKPTNPQVLRLEDEKKYILQSLSELERKFHQSSMSNGGENTVAADGSDGGVGTLENEISNLNVRLEALEADRSFLEHACNSLQSNGGLEFIQEIAHHLHDLRTSRLDR